MLRYSVSALLILGLLSSCATVQSRQQVDDMDIAVITEDSINGPKLITRVVESVGIFGPSLTEAELDNRIRTLKRISSEELRKLCPNGHTVRRAEMLRLTAGSNFSSNYSAEWPPTDYHVFYSCA